MSHTLDFGVRQCHTPCPHCPSPALTPALVVLQSNVTRGAILPKPPGYHALDARLGMPDVRIAEENFSLAGMAICAWATIHPSLSAVL